MKPAIVIQNLSKKYWLRKAPPYVVLRDVISYSIRSIFHSKEKPENFWALNNIDLTIEQGDRIGIIGDNGAGKSTLLKIISRITPPTTGKITLNGRVASLLEVGTGFHPELTGRENIYLNGSILGLTKKEIHQKLDEIIDFSGVGKFIDVPVKHYSSGMQLRLAFSVAAHLEPEILLIDEVLAVGDIEFQKKCIGKMEEVSRKGNRTVIFVSHNLAAISTLTNKTVFLEKGQIKCFDKTSVAISEYTKSNTASDSYIASPEGNQPAIESIRIITSNGGNLQKHGEPMSILFDVYMPEENITNMALAFQVVQQQTNQPVLHQWLFDSEQEAFRKKGRNKVAFTFPEIKLYKGDYYLKVHLAESKTKVKFNEIECCFFRVDMLDIPAPEWGWYDNMCLYLEQGHWKQI